MLREHLTGGCELTHLLTLESSKGEELREQARGAKGDLAVFGVKVQGAALIASLEPAAGRRERKKAATRASISSAALELLLERGFDEVGIRDIASRDAHLARGSDPNFAAFRRLVETTPALQTYRKDMWRRHEPRLTTAIVESSGADAGVARMAVVLMIEGYLVASENPSPGEPLELVFRLLRHGLPSIEGAAGLADR